LFVPEFGQIVLEIRRKRFEPFALLAGLGKTRLYSTISVGSSKMALFVVDYNNISRVTL
jgi:hypothetical protein